LAHGALILFDEPISMLVFAGIDIHLEICGAAL